VFGLGLGGVVAAFALLIALLPSGAGAASAQCLQSAGTARTDAAQGEINKVIVGYRKRGNRVRLINRAEMRGGVRDITDVVCPNDQRWHRVVVRLKDKNDFVSLRGRDPVLRKYTKVPRTIAVRVSAGAGNDEVLGHKGRDRVSAGADRDEVRTFAGNDYIKGGNGRDRIWAGPGKDEIHVDDGNKDVVDCGGGIDLVFADPRDELRNCERVR
jgi:Ca2+-binding RTX toxin-like protein